MKNYMPFHKEIVK